ncbi:hypothetical protein [Thermofilum pendens]|uniref:Uncharacterized protein n=1 Tax=Thermofilum pendens (strain DSM 2475 / Hrk 5) TaxID=368408 RepID=A1S0E3_THEPD|nr:hypothetical protein [Thermofilum pendens]ABL78923.1 conserved hypothetical protein [Thermofilum pendens Hrk 5]
MSGGSYYAVCGAATAPLYTGSAYWVDLRLLSGVYEAIVRGSDGSILSRYSCAPPGSPSYVGFENVGSFTLNVWGP